MSHDLHHAPDASETLLLPNQPSGQSRRDFLKGS
ncbi:MAG: hypothetical protein RLY58_1126, partial [Pseudomonadota bacterium]